MSRVVIVAVLVMMVGGVALSRAPTLEDLPSVKAIQEAATKAIEKAREAAAAAEKDPKKEMIDAYANGSVSIFAWKGVVDVLKDDNEQAKYRQAAADAVRQRFQNVPPNDTKLEKVKKEIAAALLNLLSDNDKQVRIWVHGVFERFWPGRAQAIGFNPETADRRERYKAFKEWQKFVSGR